MATPAARNLLRIAEISRKAPKQMKNIDFAKRAYVINLRATTLVPVKSICATFDPFHSRCSSLRDFAFSLSVPKVKDTNPNCTLKLDVKSDRSEPQLLVNFSDGHKALFRTENLTRVELVKLFNSLCHERAPPADSKPGPQTKSTNTKPKPKRK